MTSDPFSVALVGRLKHGAIVEGLARKGWNQSDLARALNCSPSEVALVVNMKHVPSKRWLTPAREAVLLDLTGKLPDDLWPEWAHDPEWLSRDKRIAVIRDVSPERLLRGAERLGLLPAADGYEITLAAELKDAVQQAVHGLESHRDRQVLELRFGLVDGVEYTYEEIVEQLCVGSERVRQIEKRAIRRLRHPSRSRPLQTFLED